MSEWQIIETLPEGHTAILSGIDDEDGEQVYFIGSWSYGTRGKKKGKRIFEAYCFDAYGYEMRGQMTITHWMPLPRHPILPGSVEDDVRRAWDEHSQKHYEWKQ